MIASPPFFDSCLCQMMPGFGAQLAAWLRQHGRRKAGLSVLGGPWWVGNHEFPRSTCHLVGGDNHRCSKVNHPMYVYILYFSIYSLPLNSTGWWWLEHDWIMFPYIWKNHTDFHIFQRGSNHQPVIINWSLSTCHSWCWKTMIGGVLQF